MLNDIIIKQRNERDNLLKINYISRTKEKYGKKWLDTKLIKVILGPRRAGKSIFALMLLSDRPFMYFNFDDEILNSTGGIDTNELMKKLHANYGNVKNVLFDEIQNLPAWELFANRLNREGYNLVLTGSNAKLLSKELATHLTGRHIPIEILPFNFNEFLLAKNHIINSNSDCLPQKHGDLIMLTEEYLRNGGFPEITIDNLDPREYLNILYDSILFKDVVKRHNVRYSNQIGSLGTHLVSNFANLYSFRKLQEILKLNSVTTVEKYINYLEETYLIFSLSRYSSKSIKRIKSPRKVYAIDNGIIGAKAIQHSPDNGKLIENLVFTELVKYGLKPNQEIFYYKTRNDREIDFVLKKDSEILELIQVCYDIKNINTEKREIKSIIEASNELDTNNLTIITWNEKKEIHRNGKIIKVSPLYEWLQK